MYLCPEKIDPQLVQNTKTIAGTKTADICPDNNQNTCSSIASVFRSATTPFFFFELGHLEKNNKKKKMLQIQNNLGILLEEEKQGNEKIGGFVFFCLCRYISHGPTIPAPLFPPSLSHARSLYLFICFSFWWRTFLTSSLSLFSLRCKSVSIEEFPLPSKKKDLKKKPSVLETWRFKERGEDRGRNVEEIGEVPQPSAAAAAAERREQDTIDLHRYLDRSI